MRFAPLAYFNCLFYCTLIVSSRPVRSDPAYDTPPFEPSYVGAPYRAYRAGIGHTEVPHGNRRPLDGSLRDSSDYGWPNYSGGPAYASPEPEAPTTDWTGSYIGASVGAATSSTDLSGGIQNSIDGSSYTFSGHVGSNYQIGSFVFGPELSATVLDVNETDHLGGGIATKTELDWLGSARLRAGVTSGDFLFYGTAGLGLTSTDVEITAPGFRTTSQEFHAGYVVGAGAEMEIVDGVNARVEALHYGFSGDTLPTPTGRSDLDLDVTTLRAGLSLKFK